MNTLSAKPIVAILEQLLFLKGKIIGDSAKSTIKVQRTKPNQKLKNIKKAAGRLLSNNPEVSLFHPFNVFTGFCIYTNKFAFVYKKWNHHRRATFYSRWF